MQPPPSTNVGKPPHHDASERPIAPARPERPSSPPPDAQTSGCLGLVLAGMAAIFIVACLVMLSSGLLANALLVGGVFFAYAFFHYTVWGWWLSARIRRDVEDEEAATASINVEQE